MKCKAIPVLLLSLALGVSVGGAQDQKAPKHLADAGNLVKNLDLKNTSYQHGQGSVAWTGTRTVHTDCSGFLNALLAQSYGYDRPAFKKWFDSNRPTAARYYQAIVDQRGFTEIKRLADARPGDFLAVKYVPPKDNTGHVMLVADAPRLMKPKAPLVAGAEQWEVSVIDSSQSGHGPTDTRHAKGADGKDHDGLGQGVLRVYADKQSKIVGFTWSALTSSKFRNPQEQPLVIGRLKPNFQP